MSKCADNTPIIEFFITLMTRGWTSLPARAPPVPALPHKTLGSMTLAQRQTGSPFPCRGEGSGWHAPGRLSGLEEAAA
eukprot:scaffold275837_cov52-Prasinocladus_malaysianus.AAC.1